MVRMPALLALPVALSSIAVGEPPILRVHGGEPSHSISPRLYGAFFEEINHAGDGGLLAELVRNRSFEEPAVDGMAPGWGASTAGTVLALDDRNPAYGSAPHSLVVAIDGEARIFNRGFWGVPLIEDDVYLVRVDAKLVEGADPEFSVVLADRNGGKHGALRFDGLTREWKTFEGRITANVDDANAQLELRFTGKGKVQLDLVSLSPETTWKGRRNGFRRDLGELFADLAPAFVRFPGGCYVEGGDFLKDAFRWEKSIGDIATRPGHANATWNYWSSDGLGYHEYLQACEDLNAEPLFVVNCGLSHKDITPLDELQPWIDDCLAAIEYANGGSDTKWGAVRVRNGHPEPFRLKYIEIGNENGLWSGFGGTRDVYTPRYKRFFDAIKGKFPDIVTIADTRVDAPMEMVDDHYYNSPAWFWANVGLYDRADRKGPKIYVGEYAVTQGCGNGNLAAALAEAAFMTGLERNSDVVTMASYAPMFVRAEDRKWNPDMMVFDGVHSYGTPSYHVQALFAKNRPDTLLPCDVPVIENTSISKGSIGVGTWLTKAEFKDIAVEVDGSTIYRSGSENGFADWKPHGGEWKVADGALRQSQTGDDIYSILDLPALRDASDYTLTMKARKLDGAEGFLILFRAKDDANWCWWNVGGWGNHTHAIEKSVSGMKSGVGHGVGGSVETGRWYDVKIELSGRRIRCYLDGKLVQEAEEEALATFAAVAGIVTGSGDVIVKVVNGGEAPVSAMLALDGWAMIGKSASLTVLTSDNLLDENSLSHPTRIVPRTTSIAVESPRFSHEFPARSLSILRFTTH